MLDDDVIDSYTCTNEFRKVVEYILEEQTMNDVMIAWYSPETNSLESITIDKDDLQLIADPHMIWKSANC